MTEIAGNVQQQSYGLSADSRSVSIAATRAGELHTADISSLYQRWLRSGKVFEAHFATEGGTATIEQNAAFDLTEPFFRLTVPSSRIVVPICVRVSNQAVWTTADGIVLLTSEGDTYNAGGAAPDVRNLAVNSGTSNSLGSTACTNVFDGDSALTENALVNPRQFFSKHFLTGGLFQDFEYNVLKGDPLVMIHGLSSFIAACKLGAAGAEVLYSVIWAELDKNELVNN